MKKLSASELLKLSEDFQKELFLLRIKKASGQLKQTADVGKTRKKRARVLTALRQKELAERSKETK